MLYCVFDHPLGDHVGARVRRSRIGDDDDGDGVDGNDGDEDDDDHDGDNAGDDVGEEAIDRVAPVNVGSPIACASDGSEGAKLKSRKATEEVVGGSLAIGASRGPHRCAHLAESAVGGPFGRALLSARL